MKERVDVYLVNVTILEGRHYVWPDMDSYVHIRIANSKNHTCIRKNTDCPFYNEYFVFEFKKDLQALIDQSITLTVIRPKTCWRRRKILGYCTLDLATIWNQPDHLFFQKWAILSSTSPECTGPRGYLKVTLCILTKGKQAKIPLANPTINEQIEGNLLLPEGITLERQKALFVFKVYKGDDILKYKSTMIDLLKKSRRTKELPCSLLEVTFAGITVSTTIQKYTSTPVWNEILTIAELFPPLCQRIKVVLKISNSSLRTVKYINLHSIANDQEDGFLPTFGPTYVNFYNTDKFGSVFVGRVLMALHTQLQHYGRLKSVIRKPLMPINENNLYKHEPVLLFGAILDVNVIDKRFSKKSIQFGISIGNPKISSQVNPAGEMYPINMTPPFKATKADDPYWYLEFGNRIPCISFQNNFPDLRKRFYNANLIDKMAIDFKSRLDAIEPFFEYERMHIPSDIIETKLIEALDRLAISCQKYIDMTQPTIDKFVTELDKEKLKLCLREMHDLEQLAKTIYNSRTKKKSFRKAQKLYRRLTLLIDHPQDCWPEIILHMVHNHKRICTQTIKSRSVTFSMIAEEAGCNCGKIQDMFLYTPLKLSNPQKSFIACKISIILWMGLKRHIDFCFHSLPKCFKFPSELSTIEHVPRYLINPEKHCRAHIYQGNFKFGTDTTGLSDLLARIIINRLSASTEVKKNALNPLWNETLNIVNVVIYGSREYLKSQPPSVLIEVIDHDTKFQNDLVGRSFIKSSVKFKDEPYTQPDFPPKLEWHQVLNHNSIVGGIVACVELLEVSSFVELKKSKHKREVSGIPEDIKPKLTSYKIDVMFWGVRHLRKLHGISITKPKVTLDCTVAVLESDILHKHEQNFAIHRKELVVELPQEDKYVPALVFKLFDNRSFGRFTYVGNHVVQMHRFLFYPLTREERDHKLAESQQKSYDSMDSKAPSLLEVVPKPSPVTTIVPEFKVENEVVGCCAFCKRISRRKQIADEEKKSSTSSISEFEKDIIEEDEFTDWWNKYFFSIEKPFNSSTATDIDRPISKSFRLKIYDDELEHQPEFNYLQDTLISFKLVRGEPTGDDEIDEKNIMGVFKGNIKVYPWSANRNLDYVSPSGAQLKNNYFDHFPLNESLSFLARVYCVRGIKLRPMDISGKSDPYIIAFMGNQQYNDVKNYIPKEVNPIFGRCFEFSGTFPFDTVVTIQVWDWDRNSNHDLIGETQIDLENRYYTKHRAHCGLPYEYTEIGYTPWRDIQTPSDILEHLCERWNIPQPQYFDTYIRISNLMFAPKLEEGEQPKAIYSKHELALNVLHRWNEIPVVGCHLVPEHVETRSLYNPQHPGLEQCWVDVFPVTDLPPPRPVDITPQTPRKYELRVIIWNTEDVVLEEDDFFTGEKKSDIYVKGWLTGMDEAQSTDVHYRSLDGEGNFNWRFVFRFSYLKTEHKIVVVKKQKVFDITPTERKIPCVLKLQVWDNDTFSPDDFLGSMALDLRRMPRCARSSKKCTLELLKPHAPQINLFKIKRIRGWWPFRGVDQKKNEHFLAGKLDAEFNLLTEEEAEANPAGLGRDEPNPLPKPKRPDTSFSWFKNPFKLLRFLICKHYKWRLIICLLLVFVALSIAYTIWRFPEMTIERVLNLIGK
ncbi:C2 domain [Popillia japonica]|uniref:C2 domain n=1 Tax=Popillia japonica TaxID=7064 RepID=A0AAW1HT07_POPJA